jgi:hypothetical protein
VAVDVSAGEEGDSTRGAAIGVDGREGMMEDEGAGLALGKNELEECELGD